MTPPELAIQKFLRNGGTLAELEEKYAVTAKRHPIYPELVHLSYSQIDSPFSKQIVQESRGLILDSEEDWNTVCFPLTKFFNAGEQLAAQIDWLSARMEVKLDGSMLCLWWYKGWNWSTTGSPDAGGNVGDPNLSKITFAQLANQVWREQLLWDPGFRGIDYTYVFELTGPQNRVVVDYKEPRLTLIAARNLLTGEEVDPVSLGFNWSNILTYPVSNLEEAISAAEKLNPLVQEGWVVKDKNFNRIKVKSVAYVQMHHLKSSWSLRNAVEMVRSGKGLDDASWLPQYSNLCKIEEKYKELILRIETNHDRLTAMNYPNQKLYALEACKVPWSGAHFGVRSGKFHSAKEYLQSIHIDSLIKLLELGPQIQTSN